MDAAPNFLDKSALAHAASICACNNFRKASRAVTQLFDEALAPAGLRSTQFVILVTIVVNEPATFALLSDELVMDRSTLSRNIRPLERMGWLTSTTAASSRVRHFRLTENGRELVARAVPLWSKAQDAFTSAVGETQWAQLRTGLSGAVDAARLA